MLNFSKFQKIAEDGKTVTMRHEKGHEMKILLKALTPIEREQVKRIKLKDGGEVQKFADQGAVESPDDANSPDDTVDGKAPSAPAAQPPVTVNVNATPTVGNPVNPPMPTQTNTAAPVQSQPEVKVPSVPQFQPTLNPDGTPNPTAIMQNTNTAGELNKAIDTQTAKAAVDTELQKNNILQHQAIQDEKDINGMREATEHFDQYNRANPINPNLYGKSQTDAQKDATAIGLFLGGLGGMGHGNQALDLLNRNIDRSIESQKENANNQRNVWAAYNDLYKNENVASNLAKVSANNIATNQMKITAAQLGTPTAAKNAALWESQKAIENAKLVQDSLVEMKNVPGYTFGEGAQGAGSPIEPSGDKSKTGLLLTPNAEQKYKQLAYTPKAKENYGAIQTQYNNAVQADKALSQIDDTFEKLQKNVDEGSVFGNIRRRGSHAVAGLPLGIGQAASSSLNYLTDTDANKAYDSNQSGLLGYVSSALKGTNIGGGQIQEIVEKNSPERGDSPELVQQKKQAIKDFIRNHTDTSLLSAWGLTNK